ncbi:MAG: hypothetical protein J5965_28720 [Aeriscardovia sp.]|nr:hypothetical protein [Aeriscardovia sp.]
MSFYDYDYDESEFENKTDMSEILDSLSELRKPQPSPESREQTFERTIDPGESNESDVYSDTSTDDTLDDIEALHSSSEDVHEPKLEDVKDPEPELDTSAASTGNMSDDIHMQLEALEKKFGVNYIPNPGPIDIATIDSLKKSLALFNKDFIRFISFISECTTDKYMDREIFLFITVCLLYEYPENYIYLFNRFFMETDPLYRHADVIECVINEANKYLKK